MHDLDGHFVVRHSIVRTIAAGVAAGVAMNAIMLVTFGLTGLGWTWDGFLVDPRLQSEKLIAVWTRIEPLPLVVTDPALIGMGLILFGVGHAFIYRWLSPLLSGGVFARAVRLGALIFFLSFLFFEFFAPFNLFGEPLLLVATELVFWACIAFGDAFALVAVMERGNRRITSLARR
ncbi:MAG: hypothetical protein ACR2JR_08270 [Rubrobacteraceae bacterium]